MEKRGAGANIHLAVIAGVFGASGSLLGKLAGGVGVGTWGSLFLSGSVVVLMILSNTLGVTWYTKALNASGSSLPPTIVSTTTNYICSALMGVLVFGETLGWRWWLGTSLILVGLVLVCYDPFARTEESSASAKMEGDAESSGEGKLKRQ